ncbi:MAG: porphobilinogen synthase [Candidatus Omnitrophica bacterium]|nr:porphobilinogen synthase [Candidatus Omnitrophota bacterium]
MSETRLSAEDLVMPYFVIAGKNKREPIKSMPGIFRLSVDNLIGDIDEAQGLGIKAVLLFGVTENKDDEASEAYNKNGVVQRAIREIKKSIGKDRDKKGKIRDDVIVIADVCLCGYTSHGHCGIVKKSQWSMVNNDATIKVLAKIAVSHAEAGADLVAPSAMADGQVAAIRAALDKNGFEDTGILAYSAKYASNFYGPFREAAASVPRFGDRKTYQMDFRNSGEALREIKRDIDEGADIVMVKPALAYLDVIRRAKDRFNIPLAAYNVSGEYSMVKAYCRSSVIARSPEGATKQSQKRDCFGTSCLAMTRDLVLEILTSIKRAGADLIITYHAKEAAKWLK